VESDRGFFDQEAAHEICREPPGKGSVEPLSMRMILILQTNSACTAGCTFVLARTSSMAAGSVMSGLLRACDNRPRGRQGGDHLASKLWRGRSALAAKCTQLLQDPRG